MIITETIKEYGGKLYDKAGEYTDYLKPWKTIPAFGEAFKKAKDNKGGF